MIKCPQCINGIFMNQPCFVCEGKGKVDPNAV